MRTLVELLKNEHIQAASVSGLCIIILAVASKKILHVEMSHLESSIPGLVFTAWEVVRLKTTSRFWSRGLTWYLLMLLVTALIILRRVL